MHNHVNLLQAVLLAAALIYGSITLAWYNRFAYDTSASTSPIGSARQEERYEAQIEMAKTQAQKRREFHEGQEANLIETIGFSTIDAEKKAAQKWETAGSQETVHADDARISSEIEEAKASALYGSKR
jgi:hypothetical protein